MKRKIIRFVGALGLTVLLAGIVGAGMILIPRPPREAVDLMIPILDANLAWGWSQSDTDAGKLEDRLEDLIKNQTRGADEASVLLLDYYLGEHNAELQLCSVTERGSRVVPILTRYRQHRVAVPKLRYAVSRLNRRERDSLYRMATDALHSGKQLCD
jgi:hypothetical protein